ncbi:arginase [Longimycelium tulufanense]|uniref:Arginase n=1 Tax=Longimycelium tulufanense TaxID=907463 RepID=A0A8J3FU59_9PSEU|nr:arginase [Longimycelium tulufanense]
MVRLLAVPQHQGAIVPDAGRLPTGCAALADLAGEVLGLAGHTVAVATGGTPLTGGVANFGGLLANRWAQLAALRSVREPVLLIGGDCGVDATTLAVARLRVGEGLGVVWWDAHADLHTPATSPSNAFHGMALRAALGEGDRALVADPPLPPGHAVLAGTRSMEPAEREAIDDGLAALVAPERARDGRAVAEAAVSTGMSQVYLHIDLDVLDPEEFRGSCVPVPGGLTVAEVVAGIEAVADALPVVGVGITECTTTRPAELQRLVPLLEAVGATLFAARGR